MKKFARTIFCMFSLLIFPWTMARASTFYGTIEKGYQYVEKKGSGYGVYVPHSFNPNKKSALIFAFARSRNDLALNQEQLRDYAAFWAEEAEKRGYIVAIPYWQPIFIESNQHTEQFFLDVLDEVKLTYNIDPKKILLVGSGLGGVQAFVMAAFYPDRFHAVAAIGRTPLHDPVADPLMSARLRGGLPPKNLPPVLLVHGDNDAEVALSGLEEDKAFLEKGGAQVEIKIVPDMTHEYDPSANSLVLDWFDSLSS